MMAHSKLDHAHMIKLCAHAARQEAVDMEFFLESDETADAHATLLEVERSALALLGHIKALLAKFDGETK